MKNNSALFYTCSLIEFIGREQKRKRSEVVRWMGYDKLRRIYRFADVFHCEPIAKTADDLISTMWPPAAMKCPTTGPSVRSTSG